MKKTFATLISIFSFLISSPLFSNEAGFYIDPEVKNLYYSEASNSLYFSTDNSNTYKTGFYIWNQNSNTSEDSVSLQRIYCPQANQVRAVSDWFIINNKNPDYQSFFNFLYTFADYGTDPVFAVKNDNDKWLFEAEAFNYLCGSTKPSIANDKYYLFYEKHTFLTRFKLEDVLFDRKKGFETPVSAFSYNGHPEIFKSLKFSKINEGFFIENTQGIWYVEKQEDDSGLIYFFCDLNNQIEFEIPDALKGIKVEYSKESVFSRNSAIIFKTVDDKYVYFDNLNQKKQFFDTEKALNKFLKKIDFNEHPQVKRAKYFSTIALLIVLCVTIILLCWRLFEASKKLLIQLNPAKRKISFTQKELNQKIFSIQEYERQKISRDLHDSVIQDIRVLGIESDMFNISETDIENLERKKKIQQISTNCIIKLRNICYNLAPAELSGHMEDDSSEIQLISILNTLSSQFTIRTHIPCSVKVKDDFEYPSFEHEIIENLFRIVQEALNNIEKHSFATSVSIFLKNKIKNDKKYLFIYISDNGVGCDNKKFNYKNDAHRGFRNMKERMELIGGEISFFSKPNEGLEITLSVEIK